jgi:DNA gyrase subunit A
VRGIRLLGDDAVISLAVLRHVEASPGERVTYLRHAAQKRRAAGEEVADANGNGAIAAPDEAAEVVEAEAVSPERLRMLEDAEEVLLTVTDRGFGKRSSAYEYRVSGRGGQGIANLTLSPRTGREVVATFAIRDGEDVMLVTDGGRLIRLPGGQIRVTGRSAQGVMLLRLDEAERVTSCFPVMEEPAGNGPEGGAEPGAENGADSGPENRTETTETGDHG